MATDDGWLGRRLASTEEVVARMTDPKLSSCLHNPALERQRTTARAGEMKVKRAANFGGGLCVRCMAHPPAATRRAPLPHQDERWSPAVAFSLWWFKNPRPQEQGSQQK